MAAISECIESSSIGCFESPTGTGKSMCSLYACMSWLLKEEQRIIDQYSTESSSQGLISSKVEDPDDWLNEFTAVTDPKIEKDDKRNGTLVDKFKAMRVRISKKTTMNSHLHHSNRGMSSSYSQANKSMVIGSGGVKKASTVPAHAMDPSKAPSLSTSGEEDGVDEFAPDHYDSGGEGGTISAHTQDSDNDDSDSDGDADGNGNSYRNADTEPGYESLFPKIFYCSRTHTQIAQFVGEIQKSTFRDLRCVTLGSRKLMCIHEALAGLSDSHVSEECTNMQKHGKSPAVVPMSGSGEVGSGGTGVGTSGKRQRTNKSVNRYEKCPHHKSSLEKEFADVMLNQVRDIEEIVSKGKAFSTCPYYASRKSIKNAQIVCLPYNMLLSSEMRESLGIDVTNSIVLIDEAHNLVETINQIYSNEMGLADVEVSLEALLAYLARFRVVLNGKNLYYSNLLISCLRSILSTLKSLFKKQLASVTSYNTTGTSSNNTCTSNSVPAASASVSGGTTATSVGVSKSFEDKTEILTANDFLFQSGIDNVNFIKLARFVEKSNLLNKVAGFAFQSKRKQQQQQQQQQADHRQPGGIAEQSDTHTDLEKFDNYFVQSLRRSLGFLRSLTYSNTDGKIVIKYSAASASTPTSGTHSGAASSGSSASGSGSVSGVSVSRSSTGSVTGLTVSIQFAMLNPSVHFRNIVQSARSVLLLGGTLQPFPYLLSQLFPTVPDHRIRTFACDHIVPPHHVLALTVSAGPSGRSMELTHSKRNHNDTLDDIFLSIYQIASCVPNGMVVFFTSYAYMKLVIDHWTHSKDAMKGDSKMMKLKTVKEVFVEPRNASDSEKVWSAYKQLAQPVEAQSTSASANTGKGAILFCVIGGKLSEGINFSDELARCVVVVGLPYPDSRDPVLQMKLQYTDSIRPNSNASGELYEAMCMKAVNQSIGRAIRHINDYAAIVLLDQRYSRPKTLQLLPGWISRQISCCDHFSVVQEKLTAFFQTKA